MDNIKEAFKKVKNDTDDLKFELNSLKKEINDLKEKLIKSKNSFQNFDKKINYLIEKKNNFSTREIKNKTKENFSSTHNMVRDHLKPLNLSISTGNEGASTDRQTDRQTDRNGKNSSKDAFKDAFEIINSLDNIKKELRLKFKRLTKQEMLVFSTLYLLSEGKGYSNYSEIAKKLSLTESSIRDYIQRLIKKGIPVEKQRINNKNINLFISNNLKKIASLSTILQLRNL